MQRIQTPKQRNLSLTRRRNNGSMQGASPPVLAGGAVRTRQDGWVHLHGWLYDNESISQYVENTLHTPYSGLANEPWLPVCFYVGQFRPLSMTFIMRSVTEINCAQCISGATNPLKALVYLCLSTYIVTKCPQKQRWKLSWGVLTRAGHALVHVFWWGTLSLCKLCGHSLAPFQNYVTSVCCEIDTQREFRCCMYTWLLWALHLVNVFSVKILKEHGI